MDVTFEFDEPLLEEARRIALRRGTTVEQLILNCIEELAKADETPSSDDNLAPKH